MEEICTVQNFLKDRILNQENCPKTKVFGQALFNLQQEIYFLSSLGL